MSIAWKRLSSPRLAAMAISASSANNLFNECVDLRVAIDNYKKGKDVEIEEETVTEEQLKAELIWDKISKSGLRLDAQRLIADCFSTVLGEDVKPDYSSEPPDSLNGALVFSGKYPFLPLVPLNNPNNHNYPIGTVCVLRYSGDRGYALKISGYTGNELPGRWKDSFAFPSADNLARFFSAKHGNSIWVIRRHISNKPSVKDMYEKLEEDRKSSKDIIDKYLESSLILQKCGLIVIR